MFQVIQSGDQIFFWVCSNDRDKNGFSYFAVQYVGPLTWCDRFRYSVTLRTADGKQALTEYQNTSSYNVLPYTVMTRRKSAEFFNSYVNLCLDQNKTLSIEMDVRFLGLKTNLEFSPEDDPWANFEIPI